MRLAWYEMAAAMKVGTSVLASMNEQERKSIYRQTQLHQIDAIVAAMPIAYRFPILPICKGKRNYLRDDRVMFYGSLAPFVESSRKLEPGTERRLSLPCRPPLAL